MSRCYSNLGQSLVLLCVLGVQPSFAQSIVYSLSYVDTPASFKARFAGVSPAPGLRTHPQNLAMMRTHRKTEIHALRLSDNKRTVLFSDEDTPLEILGPASVSPDGKAYVKATLREWHGAPSPGVTADTAIFELALDASNTFRRILDDQPNQSAPQFNQQGTKAALETFIDGKYFISIHAVPGWKLLRKTNLSDLMSRSCPACTPIDFGWMADGNRLFIELTVVGDDEDAAPTAPGTYVISEDGSGMTRIPDSAAAFRLDGYIHPRFIERHFLRQLSDGAYIFQDFAVKSGDSFSAAHPFLVTGKADGAASSILPLKTSISQPFLPASGNYLAFIGSRTTATYRSEQHLWIIDLQTKDQKELLSVPPPGPPSSPDPNVFLSLLGWIN